jgi:tryptophanase
MIEPVRIPTQAERTACIKEAGYNTFLLKSNDVSIILYKVLFSDKCFDMYIIC